MKPIASMQALQSRLADDGFAFVASARASGLFGGLRASPGWDRFASSWDHLVVDAYLAAHGRMRRRRHATYAISAGGAIERLAHQPHYQSRQYNALQGGIQRWFEPLATDLGNSTVLRRMLGVGAHVFQLVSQAAPAWRVEVHQFRIEAQADRPGLPTPEGVHRDGVDFVLVVLVARNNIASGTTTIHAADGSRIGEFTLATPMDTAWVVDSRVLHGVTPVHAVAASQPAWRDVLVVTYTRVGL